MGLTALHLRSKELEERLQQAHLRNESDRALAQQELLQRNVERERLEQQIRELESERIGGTTRLQALEAQVKALEEQLAASRASVPSTEAPMGNARAMTAAELLHRAEWITACAVGDILPHGLVAAEAYASAALVDDPQNAIAAQLVAELARIHRAFKEGLPPVADSIASFEQRAATYLNADPAHAADVAEDEAKRRARGGLNRSALLATNLALELRLKIGPADNPAVLALQELQAALVERLG